MLSRRWIRRWHSMTCPGWQFSPNVCPLLQQRGEIEWQLDSLPVWFAEEEPTLAADRDDHWIITAPVYLQEEQGDYAEFELAGDKEQLLGYVMINVSKDSLQSLTTNLFSYNLMIGLGFATLLLWLQNAGLKRITRPTA